MRIRKVSHNNRKKAFDVVTTRGTYRFPYAKLDSPPSRDNPIVSVYVDKELGREAFTYELRSGDEGTVHLDHVLHYSRDPQYLRDLLLYRLTVEAQERVKRSSLSKREIIRRLGTSPAQFYRLLDQTNYTKSMDQVVTLLHALDCKVDFSVQEKSLRMTG